MKISNCCGSPGTKLWDDDVTYREVDICDKCGEHCAYLKDEPDDEDIYRDGGMTANEHREMETIRIKNQINNL